MTRLHRVLLAALVGAVLALPARATTVSGSVRDSGGNAVSGAAISFRLINIGRGNVARESGTSIVTPALVSASSAADGTFSVTLVGNDAITPAGTLYEVVIRGPGFTYGPFDYSITGSAANLNSLTPEATFPNTSSQVAASQLVAPAGCAANQVLEWTGTAWTCVAAGSGSGAQHQVNGTNVTANATINFENSPPADGLTLTFANPSAGNVQLGLSGTLTDAGLASGYSGTGSCPAHQWIFSLTRNGAPTCTQPAYTDISGTPTLFNQTIDANGTARAQRPSVNFSTNFSVADNAVSNRTDLDLASMISSNTSGNAATATALASAPTQCTAGQFATGIAASGNANCGTPASAPARNVILLSPSCNGASNCFQVKDDGFMATDCSVTSGSAVVTCTGSHFTAAMADGSHHIAVYKSCSTDAGLASYGVLLGASGATISGFTSGTSITASVNATGTQSGNACVYIASLDDTAISNADAAAQASSTCPVIDLPSGIMGISQPHFQALPTSCSINGVKTGESAYGPLYTIKGQGKNNSQLWMTPDFNFAACTAGADSHGCFVLYFAKWKGWSLTGGGLPSFTTVTGIVTTLATSTGYLDNWGCVNVGANSSSPSQAGLYSASDQTYIFNSLFDGCGGSAVRIASGKVEALNSSFQDSGQAEIYAPGASVQFHSFGGNKYFGANGMAAFKNIIQGGNITTGPGDSFFTNGASNTIRCWQSNDANDSLTMIGGNTCDAQQGIVIQNTGVKLTMSNVALTGATGSIISTTGNPATIVDLGGNSVAIAPSLIAGTTVQQSNSILGAQVAANITPSTGWGTTGAAGNGVSAASGTSQSERFTITAAGVPTANPTVAITFPQAFWLAPLCTAQQIGGTGAIQALTTDGTESTTAVTLTWHGTAVAASTYIIQVNCK